MIIQLLAPQTKAPRSVKIGFSWTTFFFGCVVPLLHGDWLWFIVMFLLSGMTGAPSFGVGVVAVGLIFSFFYNRLYINGLLKRGYVPADEATATILAANGFTNK